MIILSSTSDALRIDLNAAHTTNALQCVASWRDITTTAYTPGRTLALSNGTTVADIVAAPAASTQRVIDFVSVYNADTITHTVTIEHYDGTNNYPVWKGTMLTGERLEFSPGVGWRLFSAGGIEKVTNFASSIGAFDGNWKFQWLSTEYTHSTTTTLSDITDMDIDVEAGKAYFIKFAVNVRTSATTIGVRVGFAQSAGFVTTGFAACMLRRPVTGSTETVTYSGVSTGTVPTDQPLAQRYGGNLHIGEMLFVPEATTTAGLKLQMACEAAGTAYAEPGSVLMWCEKTL